MKSYLIVLFIFGFLLPLSAQWTLRAPAPNTKWAHNAVSLNGYMYVVSGSTGNTYRYDPLTNAWITLANMPTPRSYAGAAAANGKIYVFGGSIGAAWSNQVDEYDPVTDTWTTKTPMLGVRTTTTAAAVGNTIFVIGGWNGTSMNDCHAYNVLTDSWSVVSPMPTARSHMKAVTVGTEVFVIAGYNAGYLGTTESYNSFTDTWSSHTGMNFARYLHGVGAMNGQVWAAAGYTGSASNRTEYFDPATNSWTNDVNMNVARYRTDGTVVANCFYMVAGYNGTNLSSLEELCTTPLLPVTLMDFSGEYTGVADETLLNWSTASEVNNDHFELYHSTDGLDFRKIAAVNGAGNSQNEHRYEFLDRNSSSGVNYYRLDQVDFNGSRISEQTIAVVRGELSSNQIHAWPNPTESQIYVRIDHGGDGFGGELTLLDLLGNRLAVQQTLGVESISTFDLTDLKPGVYLLHYRSPEGEYSTLKISRK